MDFHLTARGGHLKEEGVYYIIFILGGRLKEVDCFASITKMAINLHYENGFLSNPINTVASKVKKWRF